MTRPTRVVRSTAHARAEERPQIEGTWAERAFRLYRASVEAESAPNEEFWSLVYSGLCLYGRRYLNDHPGAEREALHDVAAEKLLDLVSRLDHGGERKVAFESAAQLRRFLRTVIRNGLVDGMRRSWREQSLPDEESPPERELLPQEESIDAERVAREIGDCVAMLTVRSRAAWTLRAFHDWPSRAIADHPDVASTPAGVDMMLKRIREKLSTCLGRRGVRSNPFPVGTYTHLWVRFRGDPTPGDRDGDG